MLRDTENHSENDFLNKRVAELSRSSPPSPRVQRFHLPRESFSVYFRGMAPVAVAMSQKPHKVRVERSGATLGRHRVVNPTCPHDEHHT